MSRSTPRRQAFLLAAATALAALAGCHRAAPTDAVFRRPEASLTIQYPGTPAGARMIGLRIAGIGTYAPIVASLPVNRHAPALYDAAEAFTLSVPPGFTQVTATARDSAGGILENRTGTITLYSEKADTLALKPE